MPGFLKTKYLNILRQLIDTLPSKALVFEVQGEDFWSLTNLFQKTLGEKLLILAKSVWVLILFYLL